MIEKLKEKSLIDSLGREYGKMIPNCGTIADKINELIDVVNALVQENNIHEKQIDELQMKQDDRMIGSVSFDKIEGKMNPEPVDPFAEQRKWVRKLCWFWNDGCCDYIGILNKIYDLDETPFENDLLEKYQHCRPVRPDDDIIYKGE